MLKILAGLSGLAALVLGAELTAEAFSSLGDHSLLGPGAVPVYLPGLSALTCLVLILTIRQPAIMRFLIGLFSVSFLILALLTLAKSSNLLPDVIEPFLPPPQATIIAAALALINLLICFIPVLRRIINIANLYFDSDDVGVLKFNRFGTWCVKESNIGKFLFGFIIFLDVIQVYLGVLLNYWQKNFYDAIQNRDVNAFWTQMIVFCVVAFSLVFAAVYDNYVQQSLGVRWRTWLSRDYINKWVSDGIYYKMRTVGDGADNPDQRISEDVRDFIIQTRQYYFTIFSAILSIYAFVQILWGISNDFSYKIGSFDLSYIPGYLVWMALILGIGATVITHFLGRPLVKTNFLNQRYEADFRYNLVRVRENSEAIALLSGERVEREGLMHRFDVFADNLRKLIRRQKRLGWFTNGYGQAMIILPYFILAPAYFTSQTMAQGFFFQTADAFNTVATQFSLFVDLYVNLTAYKSVVNRLVGFDRSIAAARTVRGVSLEDTVPAAETLTLEDATFSLPSGRELLDHVSTAFKKRQNTLVTGPSGSGKTTLFRAIAGIWPFGSGRIGVPNGESVMLLPQQTYLPLGTLRQALTYPSPVSAFSDEAVREALNGVGLGELGKSLDTVDSWTDVLSGGEKQRVAIVRALLRKPEWLFLDEATSAVDERTEAALYTLLRNALPNTTIVSIGHRSSLATLHDRRLAVVDGHVEDRPLAEFAAR